MGYSNRIYKIVILSWLSWLSGLVSPASALSATVPQTAEQKVDALTHRIDELESELGDLQAQQADNPRAVRSFLRDQLQIGGFFQPSLTALTGTNTPTQIANSTDILGVNISATFTPRLRFVSQFITGLSYALQNPENNPGATASGLPATRQFGSVAFGALVPEGYLETDLDSHNHIQGGLGYVPFGYSLQLREPVLYVRRNGPQLSRAVTLVSPLWEGLHLYGSYPLTLSKDSFIGHWGYNLYTFTPIYDPKLLGLGERAWVSTPSERLTFGISNQTGKQSGYTYDAIGVDGRLRLAPVTITSEYIIKFTSQNDPHGNPWSAYIEPDLDILSEHVLLFLAADFLDNSLNTIGATLTGTPDPIQKWELGGGANWLPVPAVRLRLEMYYNDYVGPNSSINGQSRAYWDWDVSFGVAF